MIRNKFSRRTTHLDVPPMHPPLLRLPRLAAAFSLLATGLFAQAPAPKIDFPAPSPNGTVTQRVGVTDIKIEYGRPGVKGRKIFAPAAALPLQPFGEVWRVGANNPTKITFSTAVKFGGVEVPAGSYGLYAIPGESAWTVMLSKIGERDWGAYSYTPEHDAARVTVKPVKLAETVETCLIDINDIRTESATLNIVWENTRVAVPLQVDALNTLKPQIEALMASDAAKKPYFNAAMFYFEAGGDLQQALAWLDAGLKEQPGAFYMVYRKGLILEKLGDKAGARAAAQASREAALKAQPPLLRDEYVRLNDALLARLK
jgi:hypothetical protein